MHYLHHGGKNPPISAPQTEEHFVLPRGAGNLTWKQEATVESSKQARGSQGPQHDLSPQISRSDSFLDLTKQPRFKKKAKRITQHTYYPIAAAAQKTRPTEANGQCTGSFWSSCKTQTSGTWLLFLLLTTALLPESPCLCISPSAKQAERSCPPLGSSGKIKSLILLNILKLLHGYLQKCQCYLIQWPLSEHCSDAAGETIMYPANCVMLYMGIEIVFWSL